MALVILSACVPLLLSGLDCACGVKSSNGSSSNRSVVAVVEHVDFPIFSLLLFVCITALFDINYASFLASTWTFINVTWRLLHDPSLPPPRGRRRLSSCKLSVSELARGGGEEGDEAWSRRRDIISFLVFISSHTERERGNLQQKNGVLLLRHVARFSVFFSLKHSRKCTTEREREEIGVALKY